MSSRRNWAVVERFQSACERDERVLAAFLGGSLAAHGEDDYSDLDLYVVVPEEKCAEFVARREQFVASWGEPVFTDLTVDFEGLGFEMVHFVLDDGVNGELAIGHPANFRRTHGGEYRVLVDKAGILEGVEFPLLSRSSEELRRGAARALGWFWLHVIGLAKALGREQLWAAHWQLNRLRGYLWELLRAAGLPEDQARLQERAMAQSFVGFDRGEVTHAAGLLVEAYRSVAPKAAARLGLELREELARVALAKLSAIESRDSRSG